MLIFEGVLSLYGTVYFDYSKVMSHVSIFSTTQPTNPSRIGILVHAHLLRYAKTCTPNSKIKALKIQDKGPNTMANFKNKGKGISQGFLLPQLSRPCPIEKKKSRRKKGTVSVWPRVSGFVGRQKHQKKTQNSAHRRTTKIVSRTTSLSSASNVSVRTI